LLTFQDQFRFVICATTTDQYQRTIQNKEDAFNRRFEAIEIKPLGEKELEIALYDYLHFKAPELILEEGIVPYILTKTSEFQSGTSQIDGATALLSNSIRHATLFSFQSLENELNNLNIEIESLKKRFLHSSNAASKPEIEEYTQKTKTLSQKKELLAKKQQEISRIKKIEKICLSLKWAGYILAADIDKENPLKKKKWLVNQACHKMLSNFIIKKRQEIGLPISLNKSLVDEIIKNKQSK
jgi:hypothetical protein